MKTYRYSLAGLALVLGATVNAREPAEEGGEKTQAEGYEFEEIVVRGSRLLSEKFIDTRRNSSNIVDSVGEDEMARLPALTAAEVVRTLPGISTSSEDIVTTGGDAELARPITLEKRFVTVRGIRPDLNTVLLDGLNLAIPNQLGRSNFLDWFPVNLSKRLEVIKTFSAADDANAIGGIVNVVTRSGLDYTDPLLTIAATVSSDEFQDGPEDYDTPFNVTGVYANRLSDTVGIATSLNYTHTDYFRPSKSNTARVFFNDDGTRAGFGFNNVVDQSGNLNNPGNGRPVPMINQSNGASADTDRYGGSIKLDFAPSRRDHAWVTGAVSVLDQYIYGSQSDARQPFFCFVFFGCVNTVSNQTETTGDLLVNSAFTITSDTGSSHNESKLYALQAGWEREINEDWSMVLKGGWSRAEQVQFDEFFHFAAPAQDLVFSYDLSDPLVPVFTYANPDAIFDPEIYEFYRVDVLNLDLEEDVLDVLWDLGYNAGANDRGWGFKAGLRYKTSDRRFFEEFVQYNYTGADPITVAEVLSPASGEHLDLPFSGNGVPVFADRDATEALIRPLIDDASVFAPVQFSDLSNDYTLDEDTSSVFASIQYQADDVFFFAGARYEYTENSGTGFRIDANGELTDATGNTFSPTSNSGSQGYVLPSAQLNYHPREDAVLRFAYSKSLGRPAYVHLAPKGEVLVLPQDPQQGEASLTLANPDIKARKSDNFDIAFEWYFADASLAAVSVFRKDIEDEIYVNGTKTVLSFDGVDYVTNVSQVQNSGGARIDGVELILMSRLGFLGHPFFERMGVNLNATFADGEMDLELFDFNGVQAGRTHVDVMPGQPEEAYNATIWYTDDTFDVSVSVNSVSDYQVFVNPQEAGQDMFTIGEATWSLSAAYNFNDRGRVFVQGVNLTSESLTQVSMTPDNLHAGSLRDRYVGGRTWTLGLSYAF